MFMNPPRVQAGNELLWDNGFAATPGIFTFSHQCQTALCGQGTGAAGEIPEDRQPPIALLADDVQPTAGSVLRAMRGRYRFFNPARAVKIDGFRIRLWKDGGDTFPIQGSVDPDPVAKDANLIRGDYIILSSDPGFSESDEGPLNRRFDIELNAGDQFVFDGSKVYISISPISRRLNDAGQLLPQTSVFMTEFPLFDAAVQVFPPEDNNFDSNNPWERAQNATSNVEHRPNDVQFQLFGDRPNGGSNVVTLVGATASGGCSVRLQVSQNAAQGCAAGACPVSDLGASCDASFVTAGGETPAQVATALVAAFNPANCVGTVVTMTAIGPRVVVTTNSGAPPNLCLGGATPGQLGGPAGCSQLACGLTFKVGLDVADTLQSIPAGSDNLTTIKTCTTAAGTGTWQQFTLPSTLFDLPGTSLPAAMAIPTQKIAFSGVGVALSNSDEDTIVDRLNVVEFGRCSGDFTNTGSGGGTARNSDGLLTADDQTSFADCLAAGVGIGDCAFFDFDNSGVIDGSDTDVFNCLFASDGNEDCCPPSVITPQTATFPIETNLRRLHLRSCSTLSVPRVGQASWPEYWWVDEYLSGIPPTVGAGNLGTCAVGDTENNDSLAAANDLGFVGRGNPVRVSATLGSTACDIGTQVNPGQKDGDVFKFNVAFEDLVSISVRGRASGGAFTDGCTQTTADTAVTSLWLFDASGSTLLGFDDPSPDCVGPACSPVPNPIDPIVSKVLAPGQYVVVVASVGQISAIDPLAAGNGPTGNDCVVGGALTVPFGDLGPTTGDYELNVAIVERSSMVVTQANANGGTFDSKLLVQALTTFTRQGNPFQTVMLDTGELGEKAVVLEAAGASWVNNLVDTTVTPGSTDFIPGISADASNVQTEISIQHVDNLLSPNLSTVVHLVGVPHDRKCPIIESGCAFIQPPNDKDLDARQSAFVTTASPLSGNMIADNFTLAANTTINSVSFWTRDTGDVSLNIGPDDQAISVFRVRFFTETAVTGGCPGPDEANATVFDAQELDVIRPTSLNDGDRVTINLSVAGTPTPFIALAGVTYWIEIAQDLVADTANNVQLFGSDSGDGSSYQDLGPLDTVGNDGNGCFPFTLEPDGYDCTPYVDDVSTTMCDEGVTGNVDGDGDLTDFNLAFCLDTGTHQMLTKDLPWDVACGNWYTRSGGIVHNQPTRRNASRGSDRAWPATAMDEGQQIADDFTNFQAATMTITDLHWRGQYQINNPGADQFSLEVWSDLVGGGGLPGTLIKQYGSLASPLGSSAVGGGGPIERQAGELSGTPGRQIYDYWMDISADPLIVPSNTTIWISIINDTTGFAYHWLWNLSDGGDSNGRSAGRDIADPWTNTDTFLGSFGTDQAFDLTTGGTEKVISLMSVVSLPNNPVATGLGYHFDSQHSYINGFQTKQPGGESDGNHWRGVRAPWKQYADVSITPLPVVDATSVTAAFTAAGATPPAAGDLDALIQNAAGKNIISVVDGLAAYDATAAVFGVAVAGQIDRLCNGQVIVGRNPANVLNQRLFVKGLCFDNGTATAVVHPGPTPECFFDFECPRSGVCFRPQCASDLCGQKPNVDGDVDGNLNGMAGSPNIFDLFRVLDGFAGDFSLVSFEDANIEPCIPNTVVNVFDLFAVLDAFNGIDPCCSPPPAAVQQSGREGIAGRRPGVEALPATIKLVPSRRTAHAGDMIDVAVYVSGVTNLRGYEAKVMTEGGRRGQLEFVSASVEDRKDFVLNGVENVKAIDDSTARLGAVAYSGGVTSTGTAYIGTFTFRASTDAIGAFRVDLVRGGDQTVLAAPDKTRMDIGRITPATILITTPARGL